MNTFTAPPTSKSQKRKSWLIALACIVLLSGLVYFNLNRLYVTYEYLFKLEHFSSGDKLYLVRPEHAFDLMRLVRPLTEDEIDKMDISDAEKAVLNLKIASGLKPYLLYTRDYITADAKHSFVAYYISHDVMHTMTMEKTLVLTNVFAIKPTKSSLNLYTSDSWGENTKIPKGYTYANDTYYIYPEFVKATFPSK
jgi:hypothetical protein